MVLPLLLAVLLLAPATRPADEVAPPWEANPVAFPTLTGDADFLARALPLHAENWRRYATLTMTPVTADTALSPELADAVETALRREALVLPPATLDDEGELAGDYVPVGQAEGSDLMDDAKWKALAVAVRDAIVYGADLPFERQRGGYLKDRRPVLADGESDLTDRFAESSEHYLGESLDGAAVRAMGDDDLWAAVRESYDRRRLAHGGGLNITGVALDSPDALLAGVYAITGPSNAPPSLYYLIQARTGVDGFGGYWVGGLLACGLKLTRPDPAADVLARDGRVLRAEVRVVLESRNGDRMPVDMHLAHDPAAGRWDVSSCCYTSSPFQATQQAMR